LGHPVCVTSQPAGESGGLCGGGAATQTPTPLHQQDRLSSNLYVLLFASGVYVQCKKPQTSEILFDDFQQRDISSAATVSTQDY